MQRLERDRKILLSKQRWIGSSGFLLEETKDQTTFRELNGNDQTDQQLKKLNSRNLPERL